MTSITPSIRVTQIRESRRRLSVELEILGEGATAPSSRTVPSQGFAQIKAGGALYALTVGDLQADDGFQPASVALRIAGSTRSLRIGDVLEFTDAGWGLRVVREATPALKLSGIRSVRSFTLAAMLTITHEDSEPFTQQSEADAVWIRAGGDRACIKLLSLRGASEGEPPLIRVEVDGVTHVVKRNQSLVYRGGAWAVDLPPPRAAVRRAQDAMAKQRVAHEQMVAEMAAAPPTFFL